MYKEKGYQGVISEQLKNVVFYILSDNNIYIVYTKSSIFIIFSFEINLYMSIYYILYYIYNIPYILFCPRDTPIHSPRNRIL